MFRKAMAFIGQFIMMVLALVGLAVLVTKWINSII